jgi:hypothetical protein
MKKLQRVRTRRQLLRATAVSAASIPFLALARKAASAQINNGGNNNNQGGNNNNQAGDNQDQGGGNNINNGGNYDNKGGNDNNNRLFGANNINVGNNNTTGGSCFLNGTKISTPSGDRLVQDLRIGDEVRTLIGRKTIKWIGYNKFTKEEGRAWQDSVRPIRVARY